MIRTGIDTTMTSRTLRTAATAILLTGALPGMAPSAMAQTPDFGDDSSEWARDGECDDMRFIGAGMAAVLNDEDRGHDATDCRVAFAQTRVTMRSEELQQRVVDARRIAWGDDEGAFANDGECDDMRFEGEAMTTTVLRVEDVQHDAGDCRTAYQDGRITLKQ